MRYKESNDQSAELLRLILPKIAQNSATYHPTTYTVWYEYLAQLNPDLTRAMNARLQRGLPITKEETEQLFEQFISQGASESTEKLQAEIGSIIGTLTPMAEAASKNAAEFSDNLDRVGTQLDAELSAEQLRGLVGELREQTRVAQASADAMRERVEAVTADLAALKKEVEEIYSESIKDPLTGLLNRRGFDRAVETLIGGRREGLAGCTLAMIDIDRFKRINDTFGHLTGDQVLKAVAQVLHANIKGQDIAARIGGEEFVILLPNTSLPSAINLAEQLRIATTRVRLKRTGSTEFTDQVTISLGVAWAKGEEAVETLIGRADKALYAAKNGGRNRVESFSAVA